MANAEITCGLLTKHQPVPLVGVKVAVRLLGAAVEVTVVQRYRNVESTPVEAVYVFPLEEAAAVCGFSAVVAGRRIVGRVEERDKAFATYDDAMMRGDGAFLLDQERPNVFTASVGNLKPNEDAQIEIRYVAQATREGDAWRITVPTTVSPRYVPRTGPEVGQPDGERINPEHWSAVPYGLALSVDTGERDLKRVESPSHPIRTTFPPGEAAGADRTTDAPHGVHIELAADDVALDRDFVLLVEPAEPRRPHAKVAREADGTRVAMVTFFPDSFPDSLPEVAQDERGHEVLFLLDCSGSMGGRSIEEARRALALCVRALGTEDTFNVVRFGSSAQSLWPAPKQLSEQTLAEATQYIAATEADLGGTEILAPLTQLLEARVDPARARRILILTDGQVSNEDEILALARRHAGTSRIFAFGIGAGASEHLVRGTARASRGAAEMIFPGERIEPKVLRTFARVRASVLDDVRIDWKGLRVEQSPARLPPVFGGDPLTIFARVASGTASEIDLVIGERRFSVALDLERAEPGGALPVLWARELIRELEDRDGRPGSTQQRPEAETSRQKRLVELGLRYGLLTSATSFVAVEERSSTDQVTSPAELRRIPVALTTGWGEQSSGAKGGAPGVVGSFAGGVARSHSTSAFAMAAPMPAPAPKPTRSALGGIADRLLGRRSPASAASFPPSAPSPSAAPASYEGSASFAPPAAKARDASDGLFDLLMTQRAEGSFVLSRELDALLGTERAARLKAAAAAASETLVVTSVVVLLLEREHASRASEWRPAVDKAKAWLAKQATKFDAQSVV